MSYFPLAELRAGSCDWEERFWVSADNSVCFGSQTCDSGPDSVGWELRVRLRSLTWLGLECKSSEKHSETWMYLCLSFKCHQFWEHRLKKEAEDLAASACRNLRLRPFSCVSQWLWILGECDGVLPGLHALTASHVADAEDHWSDTIVYP